MKKHVEGPTNGFQILQTIIQAHKHIKRQADTQIDDEDESQTESMREES